MKKKILSFGLMLSLTLTPLAQAASLSFSDVPAGLTSTVAIETLVKLGTLKGYPDGTFKPEKTINRAELMKVIVAGQGIHPQSGEYTPNCFSDVKAGDWYEPYVCYAFDKGWVGGYPDGSFQPNKDILKAEGAKMVVNGMGLGEPSDMDMYYAQMFDDVGLEAWFSPFVAVIAARAIEPFPDGSFKYKPADPMTRAMASEYIFGANIVKTTGENFSYDSRKAYLTSINLADLETLAYIDSTNGAYLLKTLLNFPNDSFEGCTNPVVTLENTSSETIDYSNWYLKYVPDYDGDSIVEMSLGVNYYPFAGVSLAPGETKEIRVNGYYGDLGLGNVYTYLYTYNDYNMSWAVCYE